MHTIITPVLNMISEYFAVSMSSIGAIISLFYVAFAITQPIVGIVVDRFSRKRILSIGFLVFVIGSLLCAISYNINTLIIFRIIQGIGAAMVFPIIQVLVGDSFSEKVRGRAMGNIHAIGALAGIVGVLSGGFLGENYSWQSIFYIVALLGVIALISIVLFLKEPSSNIVLELSDIIGTLRDKSLLIILLFSVLLYFAQSFFRNYIPSFLQSHGISISGSGYIMAPIALTSIIGALLGGRISDRIGRQKSLAIGVIITAISLALCPLSNNMAWIILMLSGVSIGITFVLPILPTMITEISKFKGTALGVYNLIRWIGLAIGVQIFGIIIETSYTMAFYIGALIMIFALITIAIQFKKNKK